MRTIWPSMKIGFSVSLAALIYALPASVQAAETVVHEYDELGRLKKTTKSGGPATGSQTITTYDPAGNRFNQTTTGTPPPPPPSPPPP